ncbi:response regulator transcription factor [Vagococcus lutrae]|uniref:response regulator transcription factor n=1 Tax=Vagococcus lutrae TaxID=81947 RepID=UPI0023A91FBC|nr:response regulator transcription factor [Vagococcus lutrae]WEB80635.1 response regulator transcription factor [Vagococcus lutrae]
MNYRILLLEENPRTVRLVRTLCEMNGYEMTVLSDLTRLEKTLALVKPHLVIMNLNWQNHFTYQPLKKVVTTTQLPVFVLSRFEDDGQVIRAFEEGAQEVLRQPFHEAELLHRVRRLLSLYYDPPAFIRINGYRFFEGLRLDEERQVAWLFLQQIDLKPLEFRLLAFLIDHVEEVCTRQQLLKEVWGYHLTDHGRVVDAQITQLRKQIGRVSPAYAELITTVRGKGYRLVKPKTCIL